MVGLYQERCYRKTVRCEDLHSFSVRVGESDLFVLAGENRSARIEYILRQERENILVYGKEYPEFAKTLFPLVVKPFAPPVCHIMASVSKIAGVGPMAAVAGALNDMIDEDLSENNELIIENGGDLSIRSQKDRVAAIYAGEHSPFTNRIGLILPGGCRWGVCTSSGVIGPSISLGKADAVTVIAETSALADAWATALANRVQNENDIEGVLDLFNTMEGVKGIIAVKGEKLGIRGEIELVPLK